MSQYLSGGNVEDFEYYIEKHQRKKERKQRNHKQSSGLVLEDIEPLTYTQRQVFQSYNAGNHLVLHGCAGTGKTFLSTYLGIRDVLEKVDQSKKLFLFALLFRQETWVSSLET